MPNNLLSPLPPATNDQRRIWADWLWSTISGFDKGATKYWTLERLKHIAHEIEPPLKANGDNAHG